MSKRTRKGQIGGVEGAGRVSSSGGSEDRGRRFVAVYGTLMRGECNERWRFFIPTVAHGFVRGWLFDTGFGFPELQPDPTGDMVAVEVLETDESGLDDMDRLEGYPVLYNRQRVKVLSEDGKKKWAAEIYVMNEIRRPKQERRIKPAKVEGLEFEVADWRAYRKRRWQG